VSEAKQTTQGLIGSQVITSTTVKQLQFQEQSAQTQEQRVAEFAQHIDEANIDFKETIMKKV